MKPSFAEILKSIPVLRILFFLITGIIFGTVKDLHFDFALLLIISMILLLCSRYNLFFAHSISWFRGIIVFVFFFLTGICLSSQNSISPLPASGFWYAEVCAFPVEKPNSYLVKIKLLSSFDSVIAIEQCKALAYLPKESSSSYLVPGERIIFKADLQIPANAGNPGEFDFSGWLGKQGIFYQCFIKKNEWTSWRQEKTPLKYRPAFVRKNILDRISAAEGKADSKSVLSAISLGSRDQLDKELKQAYADAGAIHVMAVSGLHVGMIFMFLSYLLIFLGKNKKGRIIRFSITSIVLWFYALMTGLSPSVTRSCLMFSLVGCSDMINRNSKVFNTVLMAAFVQILWKPSIITDAGFQFSYSAVLGILLFHGRISKLINLHSKFFRYFTDLIAVSISAQILTFPLAIIYFHQFPTWFILTNIIVIPLVTIAMMLFLVSCIFYTIPVINIFFIEKSVLMTGFMNSSVKWVDSLPVSVIDSLRLTPVQMIIAILIPIVLLFWFEYKKFRAIVITMLLLIIFFIAGIDNKLQSDGKTEFIVYNIPNTTVIGYKTANKHLVFTDSESDDLNDKLQKSVSAYWIKNHYPDPDYRYLNLSETELTPLSGSGNFLFQDGELRFLFLSEPDFFSNFSAESNTLPVCAVVLFGKKFINTDIITDNFESESLVLASSVPIWNINRMNLTNHHIILKDVSDSGAYRSITVKNDHSLRLLGRLYVILRVSLKRNFK